MRLKIILAYDGRSLAGWQSQPGGNTVQDLLAAAASETAKEPVRVHGSGCTDAGVHALAQVAHFDAPDHQFKTLRPPSQLVSQWQAPSSQWTAQPVDRTTVWKLQQADWIRKQPVTQNQICVSHDNNTESAPPSASPAPGMSTPSHPDVPNISNMSTLLRHLSEDEQELGKDQEDEQIDP